MPDRTKKLFVYDDKIVSYRFINGVYQARLRRDGYNIEVAAKSYDLMKSKFIEKLLAVEKERMDNVFPLFKNFAEDWLSVKNRTVKPNTYKSYHQLVTHDILPRFGKMRVNEITRKDVQDFLFEIDGQGKCRTAQKLKIILSAMFDVIQEDYNVKSPMAKVVLAHHESKKGNAFTKADERAFIEYCKAHPHYAGNSALLLLLYTGMRVGELKSMTYDDNFIYCLSEKTRKGYADVTRRIPISPILKRVLPLIDFEQAKAASMYTIRDAVKRVFPDRHTHELRYSFITRAKECGVNPELVMKWVGHEFDQDVRTSRVDRGYTDYSQEYALKEILKIDYELPEIA